MTQFNARETVWMQHALELAARGRGRVEPNPMVGCVLVRNGRVVGEGFHRRFGGPHAEIEALRMARSAARGATAYVTLEPCCHYGKTPPCTEALITAGVSRVVAAMVDPFPKVKNHGLAALRNAGLKVDVGLCNEDAVDLNVAYLKRQKLGLPWVTLKWAQSIDGKIATRTGDSKWISGEPARRWVHQLRGHMDAILVGVGTVIADDPELTCRCGRPRRIATRIILDPQLRTPKKARIIRTANRIPTMIVTSQDGAATSRARWFERFGVTILPVRQSTHGLDLRGMLKKLTKTGVTHVLVEGGGRTLGGFVDQALADEAIVFVSRRLIGGQAAISPLAGTGPKMIRDVHQPYRVTLAQCGVDDVYRIELTNPIQLV